MSKLDHYLSLNYHKRLYQDDEGDWIVEIDDLPGCVADGKTPDEAIASSMEAMRSWMESRLSSGHDIPEPTIAGEYSGRILLRMPKYVHRSLAIQAQREGSSLNQYIVSLLSYGCAQARTSPLQPSSYDATQMYDLLPNATRVSSQGSKAGFDEVLAGLSGPSSQANGATRRPA